MVSTDSQTTVEGLLQELGGCGCFQILMVILVHVSTMAGAWTNLLLSFAGFRPEWTCRDAKAMNDLNVSSLMSDSHEELNNTNGNNISSCDLFDQCETIVFDSDSSTIATQWNLACGRNWMMSTIISLYMVGSLIGTVTAGHINHYVGRKPCQYGTITALCVLHIMAIFSINWQMYASIYFLLGITTGSLYLCAYVYPVEFVTSKWRGLYTALPVTNTGYLSFGVAATVLRDWKKLHLGVVALSVIWFMPVFWAPESLRWLTVKGKTFKARKVGKKIAKFNCTQMPPADVIEVISQEEVKREKEKTLYTFVDLYRHGYFIKTAILAFAWVTFAIVYYAIMFGVKNLSGNFYTNLMIFAFISTSSYPLVPLFSNTIGRRWGTIVFLMTSVACCVGLISTHYVGDQIDRGLIVMLLCVLLITCIDGAWTISLLYTVELYPTPLRSLSYGHSNCMAKLGGVVAPFLIPDAHRSSMLVHIVMGVITLLATTFIFFLPETKGQPMTDSLKLANTKHTSIDEENSMVLEDANIHSEIRENYS